MSCLKVKKIVEILEETGGDLGDIKLKFQKKYIHVKQLTPTQSEIDLKSSVLFALCLRKDLILSVLFTIL